MELIMKAESSFNNMIVVSKSKMSNEEGCQQRFLKVVIIFSLEMSNTYATPEADYNYVGTTTIPIINSDGGKEFE